MRAVGPLLAVVLGVGLGPTLLAAQQSLPTFYAQLAGHMVKFSAPPWITSRDYAGQFEFRRLDDPDGTVSIQYIPIGETFDNWSVQYSITAKTAGSDATSVMLNDRLVNYREECETIRWRLVDEDRATNRTAFILCNRKNNDPDLGELAVVSSQKIGNLAVVIAYQRQLGNFEFPISDTMLQLSTKVFSVGFEATQDIEIEPVTN